MTLLLSIPSARSEAIRWVAEVVIGEMLGLSFEIMEGAEAQVALEASGRRLAMPSLFPNLEDDQAAWASQMPALPLAVLDTAKALPEAELEQPLPVLFGAPEIEISESAIRCEIDIFGSIFFMLSRFEEVALPNRDARDRFPGAASLAWRAGFLYRPIVDEYVEVLWAMMKRLWPGLMRRRREGRVRASCDVDVPYDSSSPYRVARSLASDLLLRCDAGLASRRARNFVAHRKGDYRFDPNHTFDWYMDACERHGHRAAFYFIADHSAGAIDGDYDLAEPRMQSLLRRIAERGHEIGMHGSYNTFRDGRQIAEERSRLGSACESAGVNIGELGNRQHFLRWDATETPDHLEDAGFHYDATGSFADRPGFRYGTAHPFRMWSWSRKAPLRLIQRPLVLMECSVIAASYLGMGYSDKALAFMLDLKQRALRYGGDFTFLWHNSHLLGAADRLFFQELLQ